MTAVICLFNHKGGVSKTTTTFNLGWMLAEKGYRTIVVDTDSQCNLTGLVLDFKGPDDFDQFYQNQPERNIKTALAPAFEARPSLIQPVKCLDVEGRKDLLLLPGHILISENEVTLGIAQELSGSIQTLQNLPGAFHYLLQETGKFEKADYILIDMSPSLSAINQNLLMTSDYFLVPTSPDYFSVMAINSLAATFTKWSAWVRRAQSMDILATASYPFPTTVPKFLGTVIQKYRPRHKKATTPFQSWIDQINSRVARVLEPALEKAGMLLPAEKYRDAGVNSHFCLAEIPDFNSLIAQSQEHQTPVYALTPTQLNRQGKVLRQMQESQQQFREVFESLANKIITLTK